jgi:hypothetical protein
MIPALQASALPAFGHDSVKNFCQGTLQYICIDADNWLAFVHIFKFLSSSFFLNLGFKSGLNNRESQQFHQSHRPNGAETNVFL